MNSTIKDTLESKLVEKYAKEKNEWVEIKIVNSKIIDVKLVSDAAINRKELLDYIDKLIESLNIENKKSYVRGLIRTYTLEEAFEIGLEKNINKVYNPRTFKELSDLKNNKLNFEIKEEKRNKVISFYSYKGGVGRTIALIQSAYELSKKGKKVLLIDLDLEAPSFHSIFKENIKKEIGIVDYLYEKIYGIENKITINDIISKIDSIQEGEVYLIPAGKLGVEYINKLDGLKEKRIYENKYIQKLMNEAEDKFGIEYTFIDSRTGINNWGALSLIDICQEMFLFAYPNRENIEGINLINDLMKNYKKTTIVLSRIDASNEGKIKAKELFDSLNINQEMIPLYYDKRIALAESLPINDLKEYDIISNFILEKEEYQRLKIKLKSKSKYIENILKKIINSEELKINSRFENKIRDKSNSIVISDYEIFNEYLLDILKDQDIILEKLSHNEQNENNNKFPIYIDNNKIILNNILENSKELPEDKTLLIFDYIINIIKRTNSKEIEEITEDLSEIDKFFNNFKVEKSQERNVFWKSKIQCILFMNDIFTIASKVDENNTSIIEGVVNIIEYIKAKHDIMIKLVVNSEEYKANKDIFDSFDANILKLDWNVLSQEQVKKNIKEYIQIFYEKTVEIDIVRDILDINIDGDYLSYFIDKIFENKFSDINVEEILLGKRVDTDSYSKEIYEWIYNKLKDQNKLNQEYLKKFLIESAKIELNNINKKDDYTRIISMDTMQEALNTI